MAHIFAAVNSEAGIEQTSKAGIVASSRLQPEEVSWQGSGNGGWFPPESLRTDSRQPSPAPRLNDISATSTSTDIDIEGQCFAFVEMTKKRHDQLRQDTWQIKLHGPSTVLQDSMHVPRQWRNCQLMA